MRHPHPTGPRWPRLVPGELGSRARLVGGNPPSVRNAGFEIVKLADDALTAARAWEEHEHPPSRVADALERSMKIAKMSHRLVGDLIDYVMGVATAGRFGVPGARAMAEQSKLIQAAKSVRARIAASLANAYLQVAAYRRMPASAGVPGPEAVKVISAPLLTARDGFLIFDAFVQAVNDVASVFTGDMLALAKALDVLIKWLKQAVTAVGRALSSVLKHGKTIAIVAGLGLGGLILYNLTRDRA